MSRFLLPASSLIGVLGLTGGIYGLLNPLAFSATLGIPITSNTSPALPFVSFAAARNLGSGITMLSLAASGNRKAVGIFLIAGAPTAIADAWICTAYSAEAGKAVGHAVMGLLIAALGAGLYLT